MATPVSNRALRGLLVGLGFVVLGIGVIGIVLPLVPTVDLVLLAAFLFSRSSERFDRWLEQNRFFGQVVRDWRGGLGFAVRSKVIATIGIVLTFGISIGFSHEATIIRISLALLGTGILWYVLSRPTRRHQAEEALETI